MPNPLSRVHPNAGARFTPGIIIRDRPALSLEMMRVITSWASAEYQIGVFLSTVLGDEAGPVIEEAIACRSAVKQRGLLAEHAKRKLTDDHMVHLEALLRMFGSAQKARNPLVHWVSGISPQVPEGILLMNPTHQWRWWAELEMWTAAAMSGSARGGLPKVPRDRIQVYVMKDFDDLMDEAEALLQASELLLSVIRQGQRPEPLYSQLLALPQFAEALARTREDHQREQEARP